MCADGMSCERRWVGWVTSGNRDCQWTPKNSHSNSIRVGYDMMEQIREGASGGRIERNFWEEGLPPRIQSQLECLYRWSVHKLQYGTTRTLNVC